MGPAQRRERGNFSMQVGDLVLYQDHRWFVHRFDKMTRTVFMFDQTGKQSELPDMLDLTDPDKVKVVARPSKSWKVLTAPIKTGSGPFIKLAIPGQLGRKDQELRPWVDWIPSDPFRDGGSVFVRPGVQIPLHTNVMLTHQNGSTIRVKLPRSFTTVSKRIKEVSTVPTKKDRFSMLDDDDI